VTSGEKAKERANKGTASNYGAGLGEREAGYGDGGSVVDLIGLERIVATKRRVTEGGGGIDKPWSAINPFERGDVSCCPAYGGRRDQAFYGKISLI